MHILCENLKSYFQNSGNKLFAKDSDGEFLHYLKCIVFEALIEIKWMHSALCFAGRLLYSEFKMGFVRSQAHVDSIKI